MSETKKIYGLISKIMAEVGSIEKKRSNTTQGAGYKFRGIDDVYAALQPVLSSNGVFYAPEVLEQVREERQSKSGNTLLYTILKVRFSFFADDGSSFPVVTIGEAMDSGDKSANKAMSAALKYALLQLFCIPTEEPKDTENETHEVVAKGVVVQPKSSPATSQGIYRVPFGKKYKGRSLEEIANDPTEGPQGIRSFIQFLEDSAARDAKPLGDMAAEFILQAETFLGSLENKNHDDIPF